MNTVLWIVQAALAMMFAMAGLMKASVPKEKLGEKMGWVEGFSQSQIRMIGVLEILAAIGLIAPGVTGILPILTPLAAVGLALTMIGAAMTHAKRDEMKHVGMTIVLLLLSTIVAYGRFSAAPLG